MAYLETLAERFVQAGGLAPGDQDKIITDAADHVRFGWKYHRDNPQSPATQLATSIRRWISSPDDGDEALAAGAGSIEETARAHRFLSRTLSALPRSTLKPREVKLFITFFLSMFQLQDANISAATEALTSLVWMDNFDLAGSEDVLTTIGSMNPETYTKQVAKTRLEILQLTKILLSGQCGTYLKSKYEGSGHLLKVLGLAGRERDPYNLLRWFRDLNTVLKQSDLSKEVADAAFECFSPFFPISIRRSTATGPEVTEQQLKDALNSCFSANARLAHRTIPFLVEKLDGSASLTAAAKLDIIRTIKSCVEGYEPVDTYVLPYLPQIWSSLKYEVRNGEVPEAIQETLLVFEAVTARLARDSSPAELKQFVDAVWNDSAEDCFENPTYTEQLGSIMISVARAHIEPYHHLSPLIVDAVDRALAQPKSPAHTKTLLLILNNLLRARRQLLNAPLARPETHDAGILARVRDICFKALKDNGVDNPNKEQVRVSEEALEGLSQIVQQPCPNDNRTAEETGYAANSLQEICSTLAFRYMNDFSIRPADPSDGYKTVERAAGQALRTTVRYYPEGYGKIVSNLVDEVVKRSWTGTPPDRSLKSLQSGCLKLAYIGCTVTPDASSVAIVNFSIFGGSMLKLLGVLLTSKASFEASAWVAQALHKGVFGFMRTPEVQRYLEVVQNFSEGEAAWSLTAVEAAVKKALPTFPDLVAAQLDQFDPSQVVHFMSQGPTTQDAAFVGSFLQLGIYIVAQLYQNSTEEISGGSSAARLDLSEHLKIAAGNGDIPATSVVSQKIWRDRYLEAVGNIGRTVLVDLGLSAQKALELGEQVVACFHSTRTETQSLDWGYHAHSTIAYLSRGVASAVRPQIVLDLGSNIYDLLLGDFESISRLPANVLLAREQITQQLANKYDTRSNPTADPMGQEHESWRRVITEINSLLTDANAMANISLEHFARVVNILVGALRRGDRYVSGETESAISQAATKGGPQQGKYMARILAQLVRTPADLDIGPRDHTIQKRLCQQRLYYQCVRPALQRAYPLSPEEEDAVIYAIYVLHGAKNLTWEQYDEDRAEILRIALAAMQKAEHLSDVDAACTIVLHLVDASIGEYVSTIVAACKHVYQKVFPVPRLHEDSDEEDLTNPWTEVPLKDVKRQYVQKVNPVEIRQKSIRLLRKLPSKFDEMVVRPYAHIVLAHLAEVQADKSREVRQLAQAAREEWTKVAE